MESFDDRLTTQLAYHQKTNEMHLIVFTIFALDDSNPGQSCNSAEDHRSRWFLSSLGTPRLRSGHAGTAI